MIILTGCYDIALNIITECNTWSDWLQDPTIPGLISEECYRNIIICCRVLHDVNVFDRIVNIADLTSGTFGT